MSTAPRTDAWFGEFNGSTAAIICRKLERELAEAQARVKELEKTNLPEDVRAFIYTVTLHLQAHASRTIEQNAWMFQTAYQLYSKYNVEGRPVR